MGNAYPLRGTNPTSLRQGPVQSMPYMEFPMNRQAIPRSVRANIPHETPPPIAKLCAAIPTDSDGSLRLTQTEDNANKPAQMQAKSRKQPQQQLLKLSTVNKAPQSASQAAQQRASDQPLITSDEAANKPDFDAVLATAVQEPSANPISTSHSDTITATSPPTPLKTDLFYCPVPNCSKNYRKKCRVIEHMRRRHCKEGSPIFQCQEPKCDLKYDTLDELKSHQRSRGHVKSYEILLNTEKKVEGGVEPEPVKRPKTEETNTNMRYNCAKCEKSYSTKYRRDAHAALCTGEGDKVFRCAYPGCGKAYATKDSLTRHMKKNPHGEAVQEKKEAEGITQEKQLEKGKEGNVEYHDRVQELVDLFDEI